MITQLGVISEISIMKYHSWNSIFCKRKTKKYISNVKDRGRSRAASERIRIICFPDIAIDAYKRTFTKGDMEAIK